MIFSVYLALVLLFGYKIRSFLTEVKRLDPHACYQAFQISFKCKNTKGFAGTKFPQTYVRAGILGGIESFRTSKRKGKYPYFVFKSNILTISNTNSRKAFLSSLNEITIMNGPKKKLFSSEDLVQETLMKFIRCFLFRWARRRSSFLIRELIKAINCGLLPTYNFLCKWKLGFCNIPKKG